MLCKLIFYSLLAVSLQQALVSYDTSHYLSENFVSKLDTSLYFYFHHLRQQKQRHICSSFDGPGCHFLNNKTLEVPKSEDPDVKKIKAKILNTVIPSIANLDEKKKGNPDLMYFNNADQDRLLLDKKRIRGNFPTIKRIVSLIDFEKVILGKAAAELYKGFLMNHYYSNKVDYQDIGEAYSAPSKYSTAVKFNGFRIPQENLIVKKAKDSKEKNKFDPGDYSTPAEIYVYAPENVAGTITFNNPLRVKHFYVRKNNWKAYLASKKEKKLDKFVYSAQGYLKGAQVYRFFHSEADLSYNMWVKLSGPDNQAILFDKIVLEDNTDLDNLLIEVEVEVDNSFLKEENKVSFEAPGSPIKVMTFTKESDILNLIGVNNIEDLENLDLNQEIDLLELSKTLQSLLEKDLVLSNQPLDKEGQEKARKKKEQRGKKKI